MHRLIVTRPLPILFLLIIILNGGCQSQCDIKGNWILKKGRFLGNYEVSAPYAFNRVNIYKDTLMLASGFFYLTEDLITHWPVGKYPFVYYGNKEKITIDDDSLFLYSKPYNTWSSFKIKCDGNELFLINKKDSLFLTRAKTTSDNSCVIKYIKAATYSSEVLGINYKVSYSIDDKLKVEELNKKSTSYGTHIINLKRGEFKSICEGFNNVDILHLKKLYPAEVSDFVTVELEIGLENGQIIKTELQNDDYPDELRLALIPVLYNHQRFLYGDLPAVK